MTAVVQRWQQLKRAMGARWDRYWRRVLDLVDDPHQQEMTTVHDTRVANEHEAKALIRAAHLMSRRVRRREEAR